MKSIDGLKSRDEKVKSVVKNTTPNNTKSINRTPKPAMKPAKKPTPKPSNKIEPKEFIEKIPENAPVNTPEAVPEAEELSNSSEDFLKPVNSFDLELSSDDIKQEEEVTEKDKKKEKVKKEKKKPSKARKIITSILLILVLGVIGVVAWGLFYGNDIISKLTNGNSSIFDIVHLMSEKHVELKKDENGRTNILVFGTSGYNMEGDEGDGVHDGAQLTDSIMVISFDQATNDVAMVSLPRDLKAGVTCTATGKVNEVYWCNNMYGEDEEAGAIALANKMKEILGVDIQYYVHVNWQTVATLVDMVGGIDITLDEDILDYYYTGAVFEAGVEYHIDGEQALGLARARHGTGGGDFTRGNSQQKILIAIKNKIMETGISWTTAFGMISSIGDNLRTNITLDEMKTGVWMLGDIDLDGMRQVPLIDYENGINYMTTGMINGISYVLPTAGADNYYALQEYIQAELLTTPEKPEEAAPVSENTSESSAEEVGE